MFFQAAVAVAMINVQLPIHLGKVIDVLSNASLNQIDTTFLHQLKEPAIRLFSIYVLQVWRIISLMILFLDVLTTNYFWS